jgi:hypothetical protein
MSNNAKNGYQPTEKLDTSNPPKEIIVVPAKELGYNLMNLHTLRKHFHRMGNRADRELAACQSEEHKPALRSNRDFFKSVANYLDIADLIKMSEL